MRILMVTPYPPLRDGIAAYAVQSVARLRAEGHDVEVLSPGPSAAHHHLDLTNPRGPLALGRRLRRYDKVIIQFYPGLFHSSSFSEPRWAAISLTLAAAFAAAGNVEVRVHESDPKWARQSRLIAGAERVLWRAPARIIVHTEVERQALAQDYGVPLDRIEVGRHGADFVPRTELDRSGARARLGIPGDQLMFLSIGFLQPHKGFDRAIQAFGTLGAAGCRLDVVGSVRVEETAHGDHLQELRRLAAATPGVALHVGFVSDNEFDEWLVASDYVVLPYRQIWSSSVLERAALHHRPVIATVVGGLAAQARADTILVSTDDELAHAMRTVAGETVPLRREEWKLASPVDRDTVMAEVRARATEQRSWLTPAGTPAAPRPAAVGLRSAAAEIPLLELPAVDAPQRGVRVLRRLVRSMTAWELNPVIHQVNLVREALEGEAARLDERIARIEARLDPMTTQLEGVIDEAEALGTDVASLRSDVRVLVAEARARLQDPEQESAPPPLASLVDQRLSPLYDDFESAFRGSREEVMGRQRIYLADVAPLAEPGTPVVDVGCGRGEWLELLRDHDIPAYGVDTNAAFAAANRARGLDVRVGDALRHLQALPEGGLAAVSAFHIVEHVQVDALVDLVDASLRALRPGGVLIVETPNPTNVTVGSASFYVDPTHQRPVHPHFLKFLLAARGFVDVELRLLHPSAEKRFEAPAAGSGDGGDLGRMVEFVNESFFGPQDFAVIGHRPSTKDPDGRLGHGGLAEPPRGSSRPR